MPVVSSSLQAERSLQTAIGAAEAAALNGMAGGPS
jgi:hypothetical protein